jgi:hypothetical protein
VRRARATWVLAAMRIAGGKGEKMNDVCCWCRKSTKIYGNGACKKCYPKLEAHKLLDYFLFNKKKYLRVKK